MKNLYLLEIAMDDSSTDETNIKRTTPAYSAHRNILQIEIMLILKNLLDHPKQIAQKSTRSYILWILKKTISIDGNLAKIVRNSADGSDIHLANIMNKGYPTENIRKIQKLHPQYQYLQKTTGKVKKF